MLYTMPNGTTLEGREDIVAEGRDLFSWENYKLSLPNFSPGGDPAHCAGAAMGLCKVHGHECEACGLVFRCYDKWSAIYRKQIPPRRRVQAAWFRKASPAEFVVALMWNRRAPRSEAQQFRFSAGAEVKAQWQIVKMGRVADLLSDLFGISAAVYSTRSDLDWTPRGALVLNASGWGTPGVDCDNRVDVPCVCGHDGPGTCSGACGDPADGGCDWCYTRGGRSIRIQYHNSVFNGTNGPKYRARLERQAFEYAAARIAIG